MKIYLVKVTELVIAISEYPLSKDKDWRHHPDSQGKRVNYYNSSQSEIYDYLLSSLSLDEQVEWEI